MYIPKHFLISDHQEAVDFIKKYSFGTLVNILDNLPVASHIPFVIDAANEQLAISGHLALANPQSKILTEGQSLVVFTEPHAYISPSNYEKDLNVPTWNYIAVHAYGQAEIIGNLNAKLESLHQMITFYNDDAYLKQWETLPIDYKTKMANGIVAFKIIITDLQGKKKLSQNRSHTEQENIIDSLERSGDKVINIIAEYMKKGL